MAPVQALTSKQAKASFRARGSAAVTETEKRWLQRDLELERRAERLQEQEKRRAEANKKKLLKEKAVRLEREREQLGTQRRLDRFGHKSSQFHLGNFFARPKAGQEQKQEMVMEEEEEQKEAEKEDGDVEEDRQGPEDFGDDDLDDGTLLEALEGQTIVTGGAQDSIHTTTSEPNKTNLPSPPSPMERCDSPQPAAMAVLDPHDEDLDSFWDEFGSGTQIARELASEKSAVTASIESAHEPAAKDLQMAETRVKPREDSFSSGSLDLTIEDLERLDVPSFAKPQSPARRSVGSVVNPVSAPKPFRAVSAGHQTIARGNNDVPLVNARSMPPPMLPVKQTIIKDKVPFTSARDVHRDQMVPAARKPCTKQIPVASFGFSSTQLENFFDDDLQLTQAAPG